MEREKAQGLAIKQVVKDAEPVHEIIKFVEEEKIDLLIMAAHARNPNGAYFLRSHKPRSREADALLCFPRKR